MAITGSGLGTGLAALTNGYISGRQLARQEDELAANLDAKYLQNETTAATQNSTIGTTNAQNAYTQNTAEQKNELADLAFPGTSAQTGYTSAQQEAQAGANLQAGVPQRQADVGTNVALRGTQWQAVQGLSPQDIESLGAPYAFQGNATRAQSYLQTHGLIQPGETVEINPTDQRPYVRDTSTGASVPLNDYLSGVKSSPYPDYTDQARSLAAKNAITLRVAQARADAQRYAADQRTAAARERLTTIPAGTVYTQDQLNKRDAANRAARERAAGFGLEDDANSPVGAAIDDYLNSYGASSPAQPAPPQSATAQSSQTTTAMPQQQAYYQAVGQSLSGIPQITPSTPVNMADVAAIINRYGLNTVAQVRPDIAAAYSVNTQ